MEDTYGYSIIEGVAEVLELARQEIQEEMAARGINASGRTSRSFRVERYENGARLVMGGTAERIAPLETLEVGRPGGNVPGGFRTTKAGVRDVSNTFKAILIQWAKEKGIADFGWGQATILGRRIAAEGTSRHKNPTNVYTEATIKAANEVRKYATATITDLIHKELSNITLKEDGRK